MANPMDKIPFANAPQQGDIMQVLQMARQNPQQFEEQIKRMNPAGYEQACRIRNSSNPQQVIMQMMQQRGMNPNILRMMGLM